MLPMTLRYLLAFVLLCGPLSAVGQTAEAEVKAAFILNFAKFIEWSDERWSSEPQFNFCFIGSDRHKKEIRQQIEGKQVKGLDTAARFLSYTDSLEYCRVVFMRDLEPSQRAHIMDSLDGLNVLTVGESEQFIRSEGMIRFFANQGKIRFEINPDKARKQGLKISSKLLKLARIAPNNNEPKK